jgi:intracellular multiplication protein IcmP
MAAPQGQQSPSDNSTGILWTIAAIFLAIGFAWVTLKQYILYGYFQFKLWEVNAISYVVDKLNLHQFDVDLDRIRWVILSFLQGVKKSDLTFKDLLTVGDQVGTYLNIPFAVLVILFAFLVYKGNAVRVFKRIYSMKELAKLEKVNWPQIEPVVGLNLLKEHIDKGPWAMAMTPIQFSKKHQLLEEYKRVGEALTIKERNRIEVALKRGKANRIFAIQLGPLWHGAAALPPYARGLFVAFAARILSETAVAEKIILKMSSSSTGKLDISNTDALLKKYLSNKKIQTILNGHGYVLTMMASMLEGARDDGVQASADFLWLKPIDRRLWYMLNTVGRQTPFVEVAGPFAHWMAEKEMGRRILVPTIEEATNALELALKEIIYKRDEEEE